VNALPTELHARAFNPSQPSGNDTTAVASDLQAAKNALSLRLPGLQTAVTTTASDSDTKTKAASNLYQEAAKVAALLTTAKTDAMSVYGRFDSNASASGGSSASSGQLVDKVFSTGLASQNLTEAAKIDAATSCLSRLITVADATTDAAAKQKLLNSASAICITSK
jgi:hypothetical protein